MTRIDNRKLSDVIDAILEVVPPSESGLRTELGKIKSKLPFTAPEMAPDRWQEFTDVLNVTLGISTMAMSPLAWVRRVGEIYRGREVANPHAGLVSDDLMNAFDEWADAHPGSTRSRHLLMQITREIAGLSARVRGLEEWRTGGQS